jgi:uncharacterized coiled-coil protein SlyX
MDKQDTEIMTELRREWHLDRKVTLGIIAALLANAASSIWWASSLDYTVQSHSVKIAAHDKEIEDMQNKASGLVERLARIEANQTFQNETLREIKEAIKK